MIIKSQRLRAAVMVAGMLTVSLSVVLALKLAFTYITQDMLPYVAAGLALLIALHILYKIALAQVRYEDKLKEIAQK
jgi:hypothetical protein